MKNIFEYSKENIYTITLVITFLFIFLYLFVMTHLFLKTYSYFEKKIDILHNKMKQKKKN
jgi:hypothetical protein